MVDAVVTKKINIVFFHYTHFLKEVYDKRVKFL